MEEDMVADIVLQAKLPRMPALGPHRCFRVQVCHLGRPSQRQAWRGFLVEARFPVLPRRPRVRLSHQALQTPSRPSSRRCLEVRSRPTG